MLRQLWLLSCEDQTLLVWMNKFLVVGLASSTLAAVLRRSDAVGLEEYLPCPGTCFVNSGCCPAKIRRCWSGGIPSLSCVVLRQLWLLSCEDQTLLVWKNTFLVQGLASSTLAAVLRRSDAVGLEDYLPCPGTCFVNSGCCPAKIRRCWSGRIPSLSWDLLRQLWLLSCEDQTLLVWMNTFLALGLASSTLAAVLRRSDAVGLEEYLPCPGTSCVQQRDRPVGVRTRTFFDFEAQAMALTRMLPPALS